jgi:hypothetical protein
MIPDRIKRCDVPALRMGLMHGHSSLTGSTGSDCSMQEGPESLGACKPPFRLLCAGSC